MVTPSKIVSAVGSASSSPNKGLAKRIEAAMSQAVTDSYAAGITEPDKVREAMLAARERAKVDVAAEEERFRIENEQIRKAEAEANRERLQKLARKGEAEGIAERASDRR